jgi:hypothetical protein
VLLAIESLLSAAPLYGLTLFANEFLLVPGRPSASLSTLGRGAKWQWGEGGEDFVTASWGVPGRRVERMGLLDEEEVGGGGEPEEEGGEATAEKEEEERPLSLVADPAPSGEETRSTPSPWFELEW